MRTVDPVWMKYLELLGEGVKRLPDNCHLSYSSVKRYYNL